jgi:hypothetical protein
MAEGYIKLWRSILNSPEWTLPDNQKVVMMAILLNANYKPSTVFLEGKNRIIQPGQLLTSRKHLKQICGKGVTEQTIRTSVSNLTTTGFLTKEVTKGNHTIISINNWKKYQSDDLSTDLSTNEQPTSNQRPTRSKEVKEGKEVKEVNISRVETLANEIYEIYKTKVRPGAPADAKRSIAKLITKEKLSPETLKAAIENYIHSSSWRAEPEYRYQANNFFGQKRYFEGFLQPEAKASAPAAKPPAATKIDVPPPDEHKKRQDIGIDYLSQFRGKMQGE